MTTSDEDASRKHGNYNVTCWSIGVCNRDLCTISSIKPFLTVSYSEELHGNSLAANSGDSYKGAAVCLVMELLV